MSSSTTKPSASARIADTLKDLQKTVDAALAAPKQTDEEVKANKAIMETEFAKAQSVENIPVEAQRAAMSPKVAAALPSLQAIPDAPVAAAPEPTAAPLPNLIVLTGHATAYPNDLLKGENQSAVLVVNLYDIASYALQTTCKLGGPAPAEAIEAFRGFGNGNFARKLEQLLLLGLIRQTQAEFGKPNFWVKAVLEKVMPSAQRVIITGIREISELDFLLAQGAVHYHVMAAPVNGMPPNVASQTAATPAKLSQIIDSNVHKHISRERDGGKLHVVWNDPGKPAISNRFFSAAEFRTRALGIQPEVENDNVGVAPAIVI